MQVIGALHYIPRLNVEQQLRMIYGLVANAEQGTGGLKETNK